MRPREFIAGPCICGGHSNDRQFNLRTQAHVSHDGAQWLASQARRTRLRTVKSRGCGARASILSTVFKLAQSAEQRWQKLRGAEMIAKVITGVQFRNGVEVPKKNRQKIAA